MFSEIRNTGSTKSEIIYARQTRFVVDAIIICKSFNFEILLFSSYSDQKKKNLFWIQI